MKTKDNGTWWALGSIGLLAAVSSIGKRSGSPKKWQAEARKRTSTQYTGEYTFDLDSRDYEDEDEEESAADEHAWELASNETDTDEPWEWEDEDGEIEIDGVWEVPAPSIRNVAPKKKK